MASDKNVSESLNEFTFKLFNKISAGKNENFFISPYSISTALTMCLTGAKFETAKQLKDLLHLTNMTDENVLKLNDELFTCLNTRLGKNVVLNTANKIYPNTGFTLEKSFVDNITKHFHSEVEQVDYSNAAASAKTINDWVHAKTNNKIKDLIPASSIDVLTRLVLVNAIYFKGNWLEKFDPKNTVKDSDFNCADGTKAKVEMMKLNGKKFKILDNVLDISGMVCTIPYGGEQVSMTIILPNENVKLEVVEKELSAAKMLELFQAEIGKEPVNVSIPKFKFEFKLEMSNHLKELGASHAFDQDKADFSGINANPDGLHISKAFHQAVVEVNEEGTEAAAATAMMMGVRMMVIQEPHELNCNRPFLFIIHDNIHNNILFFGKYTKPN